jgi:hypothetical protein
MTVINSYSDHLQLEYMLVRDESAISGILQTCLHYTRPPLTSDNCCSIRSVAVQCHQAISVRYLCLLTTLEIHTLTEMADMHLSVGGEGRNVGAAAVCHDICFWY